MSIFNDTSIITKRRKGTSDDPFVSLSESHQIENNSVILSEIPSSYTKVLVTGAGTIWYEIPSGIPTANQYVVDYIANIITFEASRNGLQLQFNFKGTGLHYVPASMVYTQLDVNNNVSQTLQDLTNTTNANNTNFTTSENVRVASENARGASENNRGTNENTRQTQETNRQDTYATSLVNFKGVVTGKTSLPSSGNLLGDVYQVIDDVVLTSNNAMWRFNGTIFVKSYVLDLTFAGGYGANDSQVFIATANQTLFTLTSFPYLVGKNQLMIMIYGIKQTITSAYTETSTNSFTLSEGVPVGTIVEAFKSVPGGAGSITTQEVENARVSSLGVGYANLKARLDDHDSNKVGVLGNLVTVAKTDIVSAVNEIHNDAITEVNARLSDKAESVTQLALKATTAYVDAFTSGSPKGTYATLTALQTAFPTGNTGVYIVSADGKLYSYITSAWTAGGVYQATGIADNSVTPKKASFFATGKNLLNKDVAIGGKFVSYTTGALVTNASYYYLDYINISAYQGQYLTCTDCGQGAFYDGGNVFISGLSNAVSPSTTIIPVNAISIRISVPNTTMLETAQMEIGDVATTYQSYLVLSNKYINGKSITKDKLADSYIKAPISKNLINKDTLIKDGKFPSYTTGALVANVLYCHTDYINISAYQGLKLILVNTGGQHAFYDTNKVFVSGIAAINLYEEWVIPLNAVYIRSAVMLTTIDKAQVEIGSLVEGYSRYEPNPIVDVKYVNNTLDDVYAKLALKQSNPIVVTSSATEKVVKIGGIIGTDCDFTDIVSAMESITDNSSTKVYILKIMNGTYDVSNDGNLSIGLKNYVNIVGQSRNGVKIIKRETTYADTKNVFDVAHYNQTIEYTSIRNCTIIGKNVKAPVHLDGTNFSKVEVIDCNLINENDAGSPNYQNGLACGLRQNVHIVARGCYTNGMLWGHNSNTHYLDIEGCSFELYNCISKYIVVGDLLSYGHDTVIIDGCKTEFLRLLYYKNYGTPLSYVQPSFEFRLKGNSIDYIEAVTTTDGGVTFVETAYDEIYNGKCSISDSSINNYCKNTSLANITKGQLITLDSASDMTGIKAWTVGSKLYGVALDSILIGDFGIAQCNGSIQISADGTTPINFNDALELNGSGVAVKQTTGTLIGYARQPLLSGTGIIRVKLARS
ncbi:MAG TPA: hypothetical protein VIM70_04295 [Clostridium sp.]|uniref:hypothetical protein n=1 Tax=Clostridium sp. TaxID=1506 RepID=UPI002F922BE2